MADVIIMADMIKAGVLFSIGFFHTINILATLLYAPPVPHTQYSFGVQCLWSLVALASDAISFFFALWKPSYSAMPSSRTAPSPGLSWPPFTSSPAPIIRMPRPQGRLRALTTPRSAFVYCTCLILRYKQGYVPQLNSELSKVWMVLANIYAHPFLPIHPAQPLELCYCAPSRPSAISLDCGWCFGNPSLQSACFPLRGCSINYCWVLSPSQEDADQRTRSAF